MSKVIGVKAVANALKKKLNKAQQDIDKAGGSVVVGFTQRYAVHVHEDLEAYHPVGEAKYLENALAENKSKLIAVIKTVYKKSNSLMKAIAYAALMVLQREAQKKTPVDTSALKASAFTCYEKDLETTAKEAFEKSEEIRQSTPSRHRGTKFGNAP